MNSSARAQEPVQEGAAQESSVELARSHFRSGVRLYQEGKLEAAYAEFSRAQELAPHFQVSFNLAQTAFALGYYGEAQREFESYLHEGGERVASARRVEVEEKLQQIERLVGTLQLSCSGVKAQLLVDGSVVGECPAALAFVVAAGRHTISLESATLERNRRVDVAVGQVLDVAFDFAPNAELPGARSTNVRGPAAQPSVEAEDPPYLQPVQTATPGLSRGFWWGMGAAAGLGLSAAGTGIFALVNSGKAKNELDESSPDQEEVDRANRKAGNLAIATDILLGSAIVTAGVTLAIEWPLRPANQEQTSRHESNQLRPLRIDVGLESRRLTFSTRF